MNPTLIKLSLTTALASFIMSPTFAMPIPFEQQKRIYTLKQQELQLKTQLLRLQQQILSEELRMQAVQSSQLPPADTLRWATTRSGVIPKNAIEGGEAQGKTLYICHAKHLDGVHPGQLTPDHKACIISYGGREFKTTPYEVLVGKHAVEWRPSQALQSYTLRRQYYPINPQPRISPPSPTMPEQTHLPIQGGYAKGKPIYICRGIYKNDIHIGKVVAGNCNISYGGNEIIMKTFQVLFD